MVYMLFTILFPGVIVHELAHYFACVLLGVKVYSAKLFDSNEAFVQHANPSAWQALVISIAPFALNNLLGMWLLFYAVEFSAVNILFGLVFGWLAFALLFHSFPSQQDAMNAFNAAKHACLRRIKQGSFSKRLLWAVLTPLVFIPVLLLTGFLLVLDKSDGLKLVWVFAVIAFALMPAALSSLVNNTFIYLK